MNQKATRAGIEYAVRSMQRHMPEMDCAIGGTKLAIENYPDTHAISLATDNLFRSLVESSNDCKGTPAAIVALIFAQAGQKAVAEVMIQMGEDKLKAWPRRDAR